MRPLAISTAGFTSLPRHSALPGAKNSRVLLHGDGVEAKAGLLQATNDSGRQPQYATREGCCRISLQQLNLMVHGDAVHGQYRVWLGLPVLGLFVRRIQSG